MTQVTAAIIHDGGRLLLCQRPEGKRCGLLWEFPGGKIEPGEAPEQCLARECREELGIDVEPERLVCEVAYTYPDITVNIRFYLCALAGGEPVRIEHNDIGWFTPDEALLLPLCPADKKMLEGASDDIKGFLRESSFRMRSDR